MQKRKRIAAEKDIPEGLADFKSVKHRREELTTRCMDCRKLPKQVHVVNFGSRGRRIRNALQTKKIENLS